MTEALNRQQMPKLGWSGDFPRAALQREVLGNGDRLIFLEGGREAAVLLFVYFRLGEGGENVELEASGAFELMLRGTTEMSATEVSSRFDALGTRVQSYLGKDLVGFQMLSTTTAFKESLRLLLACMQRPLFSAESFAAWRSRKAEALEVAAQTPDYVARRALWQKMLGAPHRYQRFATPNAARALRREAVERYYQTSVAGCRCQIMACGPEGDEWLTTLRELWSERASGRGVAVSGAPLVAAEGRQTVINRSSLRQQATVLLGSVLPRADHAGNLDLQILTLLLGGYMGSRLMQKLREEKGYTYGVRAVISYLHDGGLLLVSSKVGNKYVAECVKDIKVEFARLREELVGDEELRGLRSYGYGQLLRKCDGVYTTLSARLMYELNGDFGVDYLGRYARALQTVTPERLRLAAREWLREERFTLSLAGDAAEFSEVLW